MTKVTCIDVQKLLLVKHVKTSCDFYTTFLLSISIGIIY